jgi:hypothetical protein
MDPVGRDATAYKRQALGHAASRPARSGSSGFFSPIEAVGNAFPFPAEGAHVRAARGNASPVHASAGAQALSPTTAGVLTEAQQAGREKLLQLLMKAHLEAASARTEAARLVATARAEEAAEAAANGAAELARLNAEGTILRNAVGILSRKVEEMREPAGERAALHAAYAAMAAALAAERQRCMQLQVALAGASAPGGLDSVWPGSGGGGGGGIY